MYMGGGGVICLLVYVYQHLRQLYIASISYGGCITIYCSNCNSEEAINMWEEEEVLAWEYFRTIICLS